VRLVFLLGFGRREPEMVGRDTGNGAFAGVGAGHPCPLGFYGVDVLVLSETHLDRGTFDPEPESGLISNVSGLTRAGNGLAVQKVTNIDPRQPGARKGAGECFRVLLAVGDWGNKPAQLRPRISGRNRINGSLELLEGADVALETARSMRGACRADTALNTGCGGGVHARVALAQSA